MDRETCHSCKGAGKFECPNCDAGYYECPECGHEVLCEDCDDDCLVECDDCDGTGEVPVIAYEDEVAEGE